MFVRSHNRISFLSKERANKIKKCFDGKFGKLTNGVYYFPSCAKRFNNALGWIVIGIGG